MVLSETFISSMSVKEKRCSEYTENHTCQITVIANAISMMHSYLSHIPLLYLRCLSSDINHPDTH